MPEEAPAFAPTGCPWLQGHSLTGFACEAVVQLFSSHRPFASPKVRRLFQGRAGCAWTARALSQEARVTKEGRLLGALLGKFAHRGVTRERKKQDEERDEFLRLAGWRIERFHVERRTEWPLRFQTLMGEVEKALPAADQEAARQLLAMPHFVRQALHNLVLLPIAEAQILGALARLVWQGCSAELSDSFCSISPILPRYSKGVAPRGGTAPG